MPCLRTAASVRAAAAIGCDNYSSSSNCWSGTWHGHESGIPWNDSSGELREWMDIDRKCFYDERQIAIIPMGYCYPGRGRRVICRHEESVRHCGSVNY